MNLLSFILLSGITTAITFINRLFKLPFLFVFISAITACGGGGSDSGGGVGSVNQPSTISDGVNQPSMISLTGVAATGLAIASARVSAKCKIGIGSAITVASGSYTMNIRGGSLPCMLQVTNPVDDTKIHSVAIESGTSPVANLTPLTELIISRLLKQDPTTYFASLTSANLQDLITPSTISAAQADVVSTLAGTIDTTAISNFISTPMVAATLANPSIGDAQDKVLDALRTKLNSALITQISTLLASGNDARSLRASVAYAVASTSTHTVIGSVTGLTSGNSITLLNNAGNAITVTANGAFKFSTPVVYNGSYAVTVGTQPIGQTCTVSNGSGAGIVANISGVAVTCSNVTYTVSGTVNGLNSGNQVTLQNNAGNAITVTANGAFKFSTPVVYNGSYAVTVGTQPIGQTCTVSNGNGLSVSENIINVTLSCNSITPASNSSASNALDSVAFESSAFDALVGTWDNSIFKGINTSKDAGSINYSISGNTLTIKSTGFNDGTCIYFAQLNSGHTSMSNGRYQCSDFSSGSWNFRSLKRLDYRDIYIEIQKSSASTIWMYGMAAAGNPNAQYLSAAIQTQAGTYNGISTSTSYTAESADPVTISVTGNTLRISIKRHFSGTCNYLAIIQLDGKSITEGTYKCSDYSTGNWYLLDMKNISVSDIYMSMNINGEIRRLYGFK